MSDQRETVNHESVEPDISVDDRRESAAKASAKRMREVDYKAEDKRHTEAMRAFIFDAMERAGVAEIQLPFGGYGDEGEFGAAMCLDADDKPVAFNIETPTTFYARDAIVMPGERSTLMNLGGALEAVALKATEDWDWINNDGGFGMVFFKLHAGETEGIKHDARAIIVDMNVRETISHNTTYEF